MILYEIVTNSDLEEGKGHEVCVGFRENILDAVRAAKGKGVFGTDATVWEINVLNNVSEIISEGLLSIRNKVVYDNTGFRCPLILKAITSDPAWIEYKRLRERYEWLNIKETEDEIDDKTW